MGADAENSKPQFKAGLIGGVGLIVFIAAAIYGHASLRAVVEGTDARKAARENLLRAEKVLSLLKDVETGQRGYLLTGRAYYLEPYQAARRALDPQYRELRQGLAARPGTGATLLRLDGMIAHRLALAERNVALRRDRGLEAARVSILSDEGLRTMDAIRLEFAALERALRQEIARREIEVAARQRRAQLAATALTALGAALIALAYGLLLREQRRRRRAEQALAEAALRESEERFHKAFQASPEAILISRVADGRILEANDSFFRLTGHAPEETLGHTTVELGLWAEAEAREGFFERLRQAGSIRDLEARFRTRSGETRTGLVSAELLPIGEDLCLLTLARDVTAIRQAEAELAESRARLLAFAAELDRGIEAERRRLAREVHDQLGQIFTALKIGLPAGRPPRLDPAAVQQLLEEGIAVARRIAADLRPPMLDDLGLGAALAHHARAVAGQGGLACEVEVADDARLDPAQADSLFRIAQEALTNVLRHARAGRVRIAGGAADGHYRLTIEDDGAGFDPGAVRPGALGLLGLHERALLAGGECAVESPAEGGGTRVSVTLPLAGAAGG